MKDFFLRSQVKAFALFISLEIHWQQQQGEGRHKEVKAASSVIPGNSPIIGIKYIQQILQYLDLNEKECEEHPQTFSKMQIFLK